MATILDTIYAHLLVAMLLEFVGAVKKVGPATLAVIVLVKLPIVMSALMASSSMVPTLFAQES